MMKSSRCLFVFVFLLSGAAASAQLSDTKQRQFSAEFHSAMHLHATCVKIKSGEIDPKHLAIIRAILSSTAEVFVHQQRGADKNAVYLSPDGHREAVYGPDGKLVADGMNDGTYNYFNPHSDAVRHFFFDMHPWILWGESAKDPTTVNERIFSYVSDLERGITAASKSAAIDMVDLKTLRVGEIEAYAIFIRVINEGHADELFSLIENHKIPDSAGLVPLLTKIDSGFKKVYAQ
jgi:hypothetical protein